MNDFVNEPLQMGRADFVPYFKIAITDTLREHLQGVREFTATFGQLAPSNPTVPEFSQSALRDRLLTEESRELMNAHTLAECLDAVCDQLYVVLGSAVACGFSAEQINRGLAEVHRSNMSKRWTEREAAALGKEAVVQWMPRPNESVDDRVHIVRSRDGKILKPPGYSPADLSWINSFAEEGEK